MKDTKGREVLVGDIITINAQGKTLSGVVTYVDYWEHWDIEFKNETGVHNWKEKYDRGDIVKVE